MRFEMVVYDFSSLCLYGYDGGDYYHNHVQLSFDFDYSDECGTYNEETGKCAGCGDCEFRKSNLLNSFRDVDVRSSSY